MTATITTYPNKLDRTQREITVVEPGQTLTDLLSERIPSFRVMATPPISVICNGKPWPVSQWDSQRIEDNDQIEIIVEPKGIVESIIIGIVVGAVAGAVAGAMAPSVPDNYAQTSPEGSPIYDANAQGNQVRMMGCVPEVFGRMGTFPSLINSAHRYYFEDEEYLLLMTMVSRGYVELSHQDILIGNTPITNYSNDIHATIFEPGEDVTSHPAHLNIYTSPEVGSTAGTGGIELEGSVNEFVPVRSNWSANTVLLFTDLEDARVTYWPSEWEEGMDVTISGTAQDNGQYRIMDIAGNNRTTLHKVKNQGGTLIPDPNWSNFHQSGNIEESGPVFRSVQSLPGRPTNVMFACPENEVTNEIRVDIRFPQGIGYLNDEGGIDSRDIRLMIQWREHDDAPWVDQEFKRSGATVDQLGSTVSLSLTKDGEVLWCRPQFRAYRITGNSSDSRVKDTVELVRLKAVLRTPTRFTDGTTLAVMIRGTNALSRSAENKLMAIPTRKLSVPDGNGGWTADLQPTCDIAPVLRYIVHDNGLADSEIGMDELLHLHQIWHERGDTFCAQFDQEDTSWEAFKRLLSVGFAKPTLEFGQLVPIRDDKRDHWDHMYQPDNMTGNGLSRTDKLPDPDDPDGVEVEFFSSETWKPETVLCLLPGDQAIKPKKVKAFGVTTRQKAWVFGMRERRAMRYINTTFKWSTELDGMNSKMLDHIALADDVPGYSQTGQVLGWQRQNDVDRLRLDADLEWEPDQTHYIALRKPDGKLSGPYKAIRLLEFDKVELVGKLDFAPDFSGRMEDPFWMFGTAERFCFEATVKSIRPSGTEKVSMEAANYDERVYIDDHCIAPPEDNDPVTGMQVVADGRVDIINCDRSMAHFRVNDVISLDVDERSFIVAGVRDRELIVRLPGCEVPLLIRM